MDTLASGSNDQTVRLWDARRNVLWHVNDHTGGVGLLQPQWSSPVAVAIKPFGCGMSETAPARKYLQGTLVWSVQFSLVLTLACHPAGPILVSGSQDETIKLWNPTTGECSKP